MTIGDIDWFPESAAKQIRKTVSETLNLHLLDKGFTLILALNYGGRDDIVHACRGICADVEMHKIRISDINENVFSQYLYTNGIPDPDLLIRTSNEYRISNFLLWQLSYTELWVTPVLWPDFSQKDFLEAIISYQNRLRRFGLLENA
jgi:undecaprenyl diphosphate synthase